MNRHDPKKSAATTRWLWIGMAAVVLLSLPSVKAAQEERWLFVFNTSSAMKKRLPATEAALKSFLVSNGGGQIHAGDSVGVWTFDQQLRTGQFPLVHWLPANTSATTSNLVALIRQQRYTGNTSFAALQPLLGEIISHSERLTVVIFCDGLDEIQWTPYAAGINQTFRQNQDGRKNARQPFVLLLRTQQGQYTGCTVNFPPGGLTIPPFPPLPLPPPPPEFKTNLPAAPKPPAPKPVPAVVPSLVIVGTNLTNIPVTVSNRPPQPVASTNLVKPTNLPALKPEPIKSSTSNTEAIIKPAPLPTPAPSKSPGSNSVETVKPGPLLAPTLIKSPESNPVVAVKSAPKAMPTPPVTNAPEIKIETPSPTNRATGTIAATDSSNTKTRGWLPVIGASLIGALGLLVFLMVRSRRHEHGSLITASMDKDRRPPGGN